MTRDPLTEALRAKLAGKSPALDRLGADLAEQSRLEEEARQAAAEAEDDPGGGTGGSGTLRATFARKLEARKIRVRPDGRIERPRDFQG